MAGTDLKPTGLLDSQEESPNTAYENLFRPNKEDELPVLCDAFFEFGSGLRCNIPHLATPTNVFAASSQRYLRLCLTLNPKKKALGRQFIVSGFTV